MQNVAARRDKSLQASARHRFAATDSAPELAKLKEPRQDLSVEAFVFMPGPDK